MNLTARLWRIRPIDESISYRGKGGFFVKRIAFRLSLLTLFLLALAAWPAGPAAADEGDDNTTIKVEAPLEAVNCAENTIVVLGLTIDISKAKFKNEDEDQDQDGDGGGAAAFTCLDLKLGQLVKVILASDVSDPNTGFLTAVAIEMEGDEENTGAEAEITAPIQAVDPNGASVTVLGLVIDISQAKIEGADDEDRQGNNQPADVTQLMVGQFVELKLGSSQPPLFATELEVKAFSNQVDVEVDDEDGNEVDDGDEDTVQVNVQELVKVKAKAGAMQAQAVKVKKVKFQTASNGSFTLRGLPKGVAKITVTRVKDGKISKATARVNVKANTKKYLKVRLRPVKQ